LGAQVEGEVRVCRDGGENLGAEHFLAVIDAAQRMHDVARNSAAVCAGAKPGLHRVRDQDLHLDDLVAGGGLGDADHGGGHWGYSSAQAGAVTITEVLPDHSRPSLVRAMAVIVCVSLSRMRVCTWARPEAGVR